MKQKHKRFLCVLLVLCFSVESGAFAASVTDAPAMPTIPSQPTVPVQPNIPAGTTGGINLSGLSELNAPRYENIDTTQNNAGLQTETTNTPNNELQANGNDLLYNANENITDAEINDYFDEILRGSQNRELASANPMRELIRRIPRFGMSFFRNPPSTYAPQDNVPVTQDYRIGVGDEITLTLWGIPEEGSYRVAVNRDGMATIPHIGAVRLAGYTMTEAERIISARLNQYYTGYQMNLSMGRLSSILVYITGNAAKPGAYTVSSFATLLNALLASGGPSSTGSLRRIELKRNGRTVTVFDMYAMLLQGDRSQDARLEAGDVIYIPPVGPLIGLAGEVQKPGVYELNGATRVKDLLYIAGGLNAQTFKGRIQFYRAYNNSYAGAFEGNLSEIEDTELNDGDILRLFPVYNYVTMALITGPVMRPGSFVIVPGHTRVSDLINRAGGLTLTASDRAELTRVTPTMDGPVNQRFEINVMQALQGDPANDLVLEANDHITVIVIPEWKQQVSVTIAGEVRRPGTYSMFAGEKLSDLIERAGGFTPKAFLKGALFTRLSVAVEQKRALNQMADRMERELLEAMQNTASSGTSDSSGSTTAYNQEYQRRKQLIDNLRQLDIMGRIVTKVDTPKNIINTPWDYELQNGDALFIPETPLTINVMGAVYTPSTQLFRPDMSINGYINAAGGQIKSAHKRMVYLLKADGSTIKLTRSTAMLSSKAWTPPRGFSANVEPGDTIVVPVKYLDRGSIESFKDAIDIVYKIAVSVGVILNHK